MKDPAFLFYSKDFYEGTRMMLPEERACYIDLLIYQHQHGSIPNDVKRMALYCSGIDEATLKATLEAKFKLTDNGWLNDRLYNEVLGREKFKSNQSDNGKVGQFWKKAKQILKQKEFGQLYKELKDKQLILSFIDENEINIDTLKGLLKQCLNNKGNANGDEDINNKEGVSFKNWSSEKFKSELMPYLEKYGKDMLNNFFLYWSEKSASGKMRFQLQDAWEIDKRLITWSNKSYNKTTTPEPVNRGGSSKTREL